MMPSLIIEESSNGEEGLKTTEYYTDDNDIHLFSSSDEENTSTGHQSTTQAKSPGVWRDGQNIVHTALNDGVPPFHNLQTG